MSSDEDDSDIEVDYGAETCRIVKKAKPDVKPRKREPSEYFSHRGVRNGGIKKAQTIDSDSFSMQYSRRKTLSRLNDSSEQSFQKNKAEVIKNIIKRESRRKDFFSKDKPDKLVMGKVITYDRILPVKERYTITLVRINQAATKI